MRLALSLVAGCMSAQDAPDTPDAPDASGVPDGPGPAPPLYPSDRTQSPVTASVAAHLAAVAARATAAERVFAKVGDSITVEPAFMGCFAGTSVDLDGRVELQPTIDWFRSPNRDYDVYGCAPQNESGPEYVYRLTLAAPATIRATVFVRGTVDVDVQLLQSDTCLARDDREIVVAAGAGTYLLTADTFVPADGIPRSGEYLLTVAAE